jgi:HEXXH motif-containing protein
VTAHHELTSSKLAALGTGLGGGAVVEELVASRMSRHLLLLKYVAGEWREDRRLLGSAVAALAEVQQVRPEIFRGLMSDPLVGAWLAQTTRQLRRPSGDRLSGDLLQLGVLAASAAMQARLDAELVGYARNGRVTLPGLGEVVLPDGAEGPTPIRVTGGQALIGTSRTPVPAEPGVWRPLRWLTSRHAELNCTIAIEDGNPYRAGYHVAPSDRLSPEEAGVWQTLFEESWHLLSRFAPARADELGAGLRAVVPLRNDDPRSARSGTARDSVGALGLTLPSSAVDFAVTMVHEFQHSKLSAVLDLVSLYTPDARELHFAPWRADPRPTAGLIQGVYAFLGIVDTWRALRSAPSLHQQATHQFALTCEQVRVGLTALETSDELTPEGRQFTEHMRQSLELMAEDPVPESVAAEARASLDRLRTSWELGTADRSTTA